MASASASAQPPSMPALMPVRAASPAGDQAAAPPPDPRGTFSLAIENDFFAKTDRYFTQGFRLGWLSPSEDPPEWLRWAADLGRPFFGEGANLRWGIALGQNIYTPEDTLRREPDPRDRPYAGWLYGAISLVGYTEAHLSTLEVNFGVVGPYALGRQVQNNFHDLIRDARALGWSRQLRNEPGLNLVAERKWRASLLLGDRANGGLGLDITPHLVASLGNVQTYAGGGFAVRLGQGIAADFGPPRIRPALAGSAFFERPDDRFLSWYVYAGAEGRLVARDIFLDGNSFRDDARGVSRIPVVADLQGGLVVMLGDVRLSYTHVLRTREFVNQRGLSQWGALSVSLRF